mmetsp:Transcript_25088/g.38173  ORF Transcript_25088/g.38173 Transcript_25088/m.38173 type:complete len:287 (-) Transcript_25088:39-899(-)
MALDVVASIPEPPLGLVREREPKRRKLQEEEWEQLLQELSQDSASISGFSEALRQDKEFMLQAVKHTWKALAFASPALRADRDLVLEAVLIAGDALSFASEELRKDKDLVLQAAKNDYLALRYASEALRSDRDVVLEAVRLNGHALGYASPELRGDREVVLRAVRSDELSFWNANPESICFDPSFKAAQGSHLACPGDVVPVVTLSLEALRENEEETVTCEATLLSGCQIRFPVHREGRISEMVDSVWSAVSEVMEVPSWIHVVLDGHEEPLSPFDAIRPLAELSC